MPTGSLRMSWGRMAYDERAGPGAPLVCVHGTGCDRADWLPVAALLPGDLRLIAVDLRGPGESATPACAFSLADLAGDVLALLEALDLRGVWLLGHSLGGMIAIDLLPRTDRLEGAILLEGWTTLAASRAAYAEGRL